MSPQHPVLVVLVVALPRGGSPGDRLNFVLATAVPQRPAGSIRACMPLHAIELGKLDPQLEQWMHATVEKLEVLQTRHATLTPREREVLPILTEGMLNKQAASILGISEATLQIHRRRIMQKMAARSFAELVRMADMLAIARDVRHHQIRREPTRLSSFAATRL